MLKIGTAQSTHRFNLPEKGSLNGADFIFISAKKTIWLCIFLQYRTAAEWLVYRKVMDVCLSSSCVRVIQKHQPPAVIGAGDGWDEPKKESAKRALPLLCNKRSACVMWLEAGCLQCAVSRHVLDSLTGFSYAERSVQARQTANQIL